MNSSNVFKYQSCVVKKSNNKILLSKKQKERIINHFNNLVNNGETFTNGRLNTITKIYLNSSGEIVFELTETNYAHYLYSFENRKSDIPTCISIACNVILITSDDYLVFAKMSSNTNFPNKIKFIGGAIDDVDISGNTFDLQKCIDRELKEEIGLSVNELSCSKVHKPNYIITRNELTFFNFLHIITTDIDKKTLTNMFYKYNSNLSIENEHELEGIITVKNTYEDLKALQTDARYNFIDYFYETIEVIFGKKNPGDLVGLLFEKK